MSIFYLINLFNFMLDCGLPTHIKAIFDSIDFGAGESGRAGARADRQEPAESDQSRLRRRPVADLHADAARLVPTLPRITDVPLSTSRTLTTETVSISHETGALAGAHPP